MLLAELAITGNITVAFAALGSALGVGWVGSKAAEAVGRNPGAFGSVLTISIIGMALAEAIVFYALFLAK
jgi:F-type H+-transporting ATPase subunit c